MGNVSAFHQVVHMVYADQRVSKLIGLLESTANKRTAIFTTSVREAVNVYEVCNANCPVSSKTEW